jgi:hypothetical protein
MKRYRARRALLEQRVVDGEISPHDMEVQLGAFASALMSEPPSTRDTLRVVK